MTNPWFSPIKKKPDLPSGRAPKAGRCRGGAAEARGDRRGGRVPGGGRNGTWGAWVLAWASMVS